jgi:hypothetical protein
VEHRDIETGTRSQYDPPSSREGSILANGQRKNAESICERTHGNVNFSPEETTHNSAMQCKAKGNRHPRTSTWENEDNAGEQDMTYIVMPIPDYPSKAIPHAERPRPPPCARLPSRDGGIEQARNPRKAPRWTDGPNQYGDIHERSIKPPAAGSTVTCLSGWFLQSHRGIRCGQPARRHQKERSGWASYWE